MSREPLWFALSCLALAVAGTAVVAEGQAPAGRPRMTAMAIEAPPVLDGDVLNDPAWEKVGATTGFWQTRPFAGQPASESTEVRVAFTATTLYLGVVCYDSEPDRIIVSDSRRDASLQDTDSFQVIFDPFRDQQSGYVFGTNPAAIEYDGQFISQGSAFGGGGGGGRFSSGSGGGFNLNWDGAWHVATKTGDFGWSVEMAIPFTTLRYPQKADQTWGVNFQRNIRRRNEQVYWASLEQQFDLYRLTEAGLLEGVKPPPLRNLKLTPYVSVTAEQAPIGSGETESDPEAGLDIKYGLTPSLTLDGTYNTDFAQVEVDVQQVNLNRFNLFFPEKRPFFLENAGLFAVGAGEEAELFFSRRIGIAPDGTPIPISGGARLSGKVGRTNLGLLAMGTEAQGEIAADAFGVVRFRRDLPNRSNFGAILVGRESHGALSTGENENQTYGLDGHWGIGDDHTVSAWAAATATPGLGGDEHAYQVQYSLSTTRWLAEAGYLEVGGQFNPEVGFLARSDIRKPGGFVMRILRPKHLWGLHELRPHVSYRGYWNFDGYQESEFVHIDNHWEWRNGYEVHTGYNLTYEGVREPFEISPGVIVLPGEYDHQEVQLVFNTNLGAPISWSSFTVVGGFFGGDRVSSSSTLQMRRGEALTSELSWDYNHVNLPVGDFDVNLGRLRVSYALTPRILFQALVQYNDQIDQVSGNLRFSWLRDANTGLFVVYNETDDFGAAASFERPGRSLIVKYSHLIDVFRPR